MKISKPTQDLAILITVSVLGTFLFAFTAYVILLDTYPQSIISIWDIWDTQHYLKIAKFGYTTSTYDERNLLIVFFPLYPYLVRLFTALFRDYLLSSLIVANISYAAAVIYMYKLTRVDFEKEDAFRSAVYLSIFPTAYFLHAGYTESLFIALTLASFYYGRTGRWALCGAFGMLAAATRITGILLVPALIIEYLSQRKYRLGDVRPNALWIGLTAFGLLAYFIINFITYGDPLAFLEIQKAHWNKGLALQHEGFLAALGSTEWRPPSEGMLGGYMEIVFAVLGLALIIYSFFRLRLSYSAYALITWLIFTSTAFWLSIPRYTLELFPIFILLSLLGRRSGVNYLITFISLIFYALFLSHFIMFRWAF